MHRNSVDQTDAAEQSGLPSVFSRLPCVCNTAGTLIAARQSINSNTTCILLSTVIFGGASGSLATISTE